MKAEKNPFRSSAIAKVRFRIADSDRHDLVSRLQHHGWQGSIVGPAGSGKSTLLEDLEPVVRAAGREVVWMRLNLKSSTAERHAVVQQIRHLTADQCCFLDGGEVLGHLSWWQLSRCSKHGQGGLFATLHRPHFLPITLNTNTDEATCITLAQQLAGNLWNEELEQVARTVFAEQHGNAREVFRACYHYCLLK